MSVVTKQQMLNSGLHVLKFIQPTGTQWLDTGIEVQPSLRVVVDVCCYEQIGGYEAILFGGRTLNGSGQGFASKYGPNPVIESDYFGQRLQVIDCPFGTMVHIDKDGSRCYASCNGTSASVQHSTTGSLLATNLLLNGYTNQGGTVHPYEACKVKWFNASVYVSGTLARDFIPVKHPDTGEACMYDIVTEQFFTSKGSEPFIAGA